MEFDYCALYERLDEGPMQRWLDVLPQQVAQALLHSGNGHFPLWRDAIAAMPQVPASAVDFSAAVVRIGQPEDVDADRRLLIEQGLRQLMPWRKGPFEVHGIAVDTEWRSDWKWSRLIKHIQSLHDRTVLDIGSGNGYHVLRMLGAGARWVMGVDPYLLYVMQYHALRYFMQGCAGFVVPLGLEALPFKQLRFDTLFSMGVLYHRRSPLDHLLEMRDALDKDRGELVLETLVVDGPAGHALMPQGRYAKMRNVWFIPSCLTLERWLQRCGYKNIRLVDVSTTTIQEQRATDWMSFESLSDFLNPEDRQRTCEGYPAPTRAIFTASV